MEGKLLDGAALRHAMARLSSVERMAVRSRLGGVADADLARFLEVEERDIVRLFARIRERLAGQAPGAEVVLDVRVRRNAGEEAASA